jgi:hypothetical protein
MQMINVAALAITKYKTEIKSENNVMWMLAAVFCLIVAGLSFALILFC